MNFTPSKISENFILDKLKSIKGGSLNLKNYNQGNKNFLVNQVVMLKLILLYTTQNFILIS